MQFDSTIMTVALLTGLGPSAAADILTTFDNRVDWLAATSEPVVTEGFEGRDALGPLDAPSIFATGLGVAATGPAALDSAVESGDPLSVGLQNTTIGGSQYVRFGGLQSSPDGNFDYTIQFLLPQGTSAFGFDISDWEPGLIQTGPQGADVTLLNDGGLVIGFSLPSIQADTGLLTFVGFTSDTFIFDEVRFTVNETFGPDVTGVDEVSWVVPSPGAAGLLALSSACVARRRRTH